MRYHERWTGKNAECSHLFYGTLWTICWVGQGILTQKICRDTCPRWESNREYTPVIAPFKAVWEAINPSQHTELDKFIFILLTTGYRREYSTCYNDKAAKWMVQGSILCRNKRFFSPPKSPDWLWAHSNSYSVSSRVSLPAKKQLGCMADHLPPPSTNVTDEWSCSSTPPVPLRCV